MTLRIRSNTEIVFTEKRVEIDHVILIKTQTLKCPKNQILKEKEHIRNLAIFVGDIKHIISSCHHT